LRLSRPLLRAPHEDSTQGQSNLSVRQPRRFVASHLAKMQGIVRRKRLAGRPEKLRVHRPSILAQRCSCSKRDRCHPRVCRDEIDRRKPMRRGPPATCLGQCGTRFLWRRLRRRTAFGGGGENRTRVRKSSTVRTTCLAWLFELRFGPANRQADPRLAASTDPRGQAAKSRREAGENDAAPLSRPNPPAG